MWIITWMCGVSSRTAVSWPWRVIPSAPFHCRGLLESKWTVYTSEARSTQSRFGGMHWRRGVTVLYWKILLLNAIQFDERGHWRGLWWPFPYTLDTSITIDHTANYQIRVQSVLLLYPFSHSPCWIVWLPSNTTLNRTLSSRVWSRLYRKLWKRSIVWTT